MHLDIRGSGMLNWINKIGSGWDRNILKYLRIWRMWIREGKKRVGRWTFSPHDFSWIYQSGLCSTCVVSLCTHLWSDSPGFSFPLAKRRGSHSAVWNTFTHICIPVYRRYLHEWNAGVFPTIPLFSSSVFDH